MQFKDVLRIKNIMQPHELKYLKDAVGKIEEKNKDKSIVNVGCYYGASAAAILLGMQENEITGNLFLIDTFKYHRAGGPKMKPFRERKDVPWSESFLLDTKRNLAEFSKGKNVYYIEGFSDDANLEEIGDISFIFIDADHSTHGCLLDALKYSQKVVSKGLMLFHDYTSFSSVRKALDIFLNIRPDFKVKERVGSILTIIKGD